MRKKISWDDIITLFITLLFILYNSTRSSRKSEGIVFPARRADRIRLSCVFYLVSRMRDLKLDGAESATDRDSCTSLRRKHPRALWTDFPILSSLSVTTIKHLTAGSTRLTSKAPLSLIHRTWPGVAARAAASARKVVSFSLVLSPHCVFRSVKLCYHEVDPHGTYTHTHTSPFIRAH